MKARVDAAAAPSTGFSYFFLARLEDWELARRRERELVAIEERECRERWEGEKEGEKSLLNPVSKIGETVRKCENCIFPSKMADFSADEDPLSSLEDFLVDRVDDLEVSIGELSIEGKCQNRCYF